jgi:hypothetical protein
MQRTTFLSLANSLGPFLLFFFFFPLSLVVLCFLFFPLFSPYLVLKLFAQKEEELLLLLLLLLLKELEDKANKLKPLLVN